MAITHAQGDTTTAVAGTATSLSFTVASTTLGNTVVVGISLTTTARVVTTVSDNAGTPNPYTISIGPIDNSTRNYQYSGYQATGGATSISVGINSTASAYTICGDEFTGIAATSPVGVSGSGTMAAAATVSVSSALTPTVGSLIVATVGANSTFANTAAAGSGYTLGGRTGRIVSEYKTAATASETPSMTWTGNITGVIIAVEYLAASAFQDYATPYGTPGQRLMQSLLAT